MDRVEIVGETIAEFDASALRADGVSSTKFTLQVVRDIDRLIVAQESWNAAVSESRCLFHWPAIYNRGDAAKVLLLSNQDPQPVQAMLQIKAPLAVPCDRGVRVPVAYVSFVETAPWNQPAHPRPRFQGLGTRLIAIASQISLENGLGGVLGLHAVPEAVGFYLKLGFRAFDCLNEYKELYLEIDAPSAAIVRVKGDIRS